MTYKTGIYSWFGYSRPLGERLDLIREAGFDSLGVWWGDTFSQTDGPRNAQPAAARRARLTLEQAHLPYYGCDALWGRGDEGGRLTESYIEAVKSAGALGLTTLVIHPCERPEAAEPAGAEEIFYGRVERLARAAEQAGVRLAFENLRETAVLRRLLQSFEGCAVVGLCFDVGHANITCPGNYSLLSEFAGRLYALHLHDNDGRRDQHLLPGEGVVDWGGFMSALGATGFSGALMLESCYPFDLDLKVSCYVEPAEPVTSYLARAQAACALLKGLTRRDS